ncbi:MAG TPA: YbhB/YbcL family Raf kinase inhibitor-like protein [Longimicrobiales bacterium]|nr:YbhB/YbcL family Raf kinase inhibitor-like protein [Longimicrobiales bacterium]
MNLTSDSLEDGGRCPEKHAFCVPADGQAALGPNVSPHLGWSLEPAGTKSFAVICVDVDAPVDRSDAGQEGKTIPYDMPRKAFYHWVLVDIAPTMTELAEGVDSMEITAHGKPTGPRKVGVSGRNSYTEWFEGDAAMEGVYGGYDGPCPPWNDERLHHYHFTVYALDVPTLDLSGDFSGDDALAAMDGHVLAQAGLMVTYAENPDAR